MAEKVLATCSVVFVVSFLVMRYFSDPNKNHAWEFFPAMGLMLSTVVGIGDLIYLIWR